MADLGTHFGRGLHQREVEFLMEREWARSADDILWCRSKLGLRLSAAQVQALDRFVRDKLANLRSITVPFSAGRGLGRGHGEAHKALSAEYGRPPRVRSEHAST